VFLEAHPVAPAQIILDLDATDLPLHGHQEQRFFHCYYDEYCYLPLYLFAGEHLLCARLRTANQDGAAGSVKEVKAIVERIRQAWPLVRIIVRGDSGFCRDELLSWCESQAVRVDYGVGLARNPRRETMLVRWMEQARAITGDHGETGSGVRRVRLPDAERKLEPRAARGGQSRGVMREREPAVCGHDLDGEGVGRASFVRGIVLRARSVSTTLRHKIGDFSEFFRPTISGG